MDERTLTIGGLRTVVVRSEQPRAIVVVLHGFAMQPSDLSPFAHSLNVPGSFFFPEAPHAAEIAPEDWRGRAWWHIDPVGRAAALARGPRDFCAEHPEGLPYARRVLADFLSAVRRFDAALEGAPLILAGFSQGGMLACDALLRGEIEVDGLALFSASRIAFDEWQPLLAGAARARSFPPLLISHGMSDDDLAFSAGVALRDCLEAVGAAPTFVSFPEGHVIPMVVWRAFRKFIKSLAR
ncbi:MAG TPA: hypothetical protein VFQ35_08000 [Polyangiaceae bacterium]|nr:hypothetical protein [Polyangiaceae bacterium]